MDGCIDDRWIDGHEIGKYMGNRRMDYGCTDGYITYGRMAGCKTDVYYDGCMLYR